MENLQQNQKRQGKGGIFVEHDDSAQTLSIKNKMKQTTEYSKMVKPFQTSTRGGRKGHTRPWQ